MVAWSAAGYRKLIGGKTMNQGEEKAWLLLDELDQKSVCQRTGAVFDCPSESYRLRSFSTELLISPRRRMISSTSILGSFLLSDTGYFSRLSALRYLIHAQDLPPSGRLVRPGDLPGGEIYLKGTHVLPLDKIAVTFGENPERFADTGRHLAGERLEHGDVSFRFFPFPRLPVVLILWVKDEEFPADCNLLLDSTCRFHLPADILWSTLMMTLSAVLK